MRLDSLKFIVFVLCSFYFSVSHAEEYIMVQANVLNVRSAPKLNAVLLNKVYKGNVLTAVEKSNGWYQVKLNNGSRGWIYGVHAAPINIAFNNSSHKNTAQTVNNTDAYMSLYENSLQHVVKESDNYNQHSDSFNRATKFLLDKQYCTPTDIEKMSGWWIELANSYYLYCDKVGKVMLNTKNKELEINYKKYSIN